MPPRRLLAASLLAGAVFAGRPAFAQTAGETLATDTSQSGGTVVRLRAGPAYLSANLGQQDVPAQHYSGAGFAFDAEIGRSLTPTFTVCGELSGMLALHVGADDSGTLLTGTPTVDLEKMSAGAGFTAISPSNIYLAANPALTILRITHHYPMNQDSSFIGALAVELGVVLGKEWRASIGWRVGLAAEARFAALPDGQTTVSMSQYALFFSATHD